MANRGVCYPSVGQREQRWPTRRTITKGTGRRLTDAHTSARPRASTNTNKPHTNKPHSTTPQAPSSTP